MTWAELAPGLGVLLAGHCLADFVCQSARMVHGKRTLMRWQLYHAAIVLLAHVVTLWLWMPFSGALWIALQATFLHLLTDLLKASASRRWPDHRSRWFYLDQLLHLAALTGLAAVLGEGIRDPESASRMWLVAAYAFNVHGGSTIVAIALGESLRDEAEGALGQGQRIGILERIILLTLVIQGEWAAIGFVLTAKSVARFSKLEADQAFAERYLIGTLTSVVVAGACGMMATAWG